jgi:hypothetical protein
MRPQLDLAESEGLIGLMRADKAPGEASAVLTSGSRRLERADKRRRSRSVLTCRHADMLDFR